MAFGAKLKLGIGAHNKKIAAKEKYHMAKAHKKWAGGEKAGTSMRATRGARSEKLWAKRIRGKGRTAAAEEKPAKAKK